MADLDKVRLKGKEYNLADSFARNEIIVQGEQIRLDYTNDIAGFGNDIDALKRENAALRQIAESAITRAEKENEAIVFYNSAGERVGDPISGLGGGGGGGGSSEVLSTVTMTSEMEWTTTSVRYGSSCPITISWSSILDEMPTGNGGLKVTLTANGSTKTILQRTVTQGRVTVDVGSELKKNTTNTVRIAVTDAYQITRYRVFTIICEEVSISCTTDMVTPKSSQFMLTVVPVGSMAKVIHYKLDGVELSVVETSVSNRTVSRSIPAQSHGAHSLEIWFTAELNGEEIESNRLYYEFVAFESDNETPVIISNFNETSVDQFGLLSIDYMAYDPTSMNASVTFEIDDEVVNTREVARTLDTFEYRVSQTDSIKVAIKCGIASKVFNLTVNQSAIRPEAVTDQLVLYLDAVGRSNNEANRAVWKYEGANEIAVQFNNFNWTQDGWHKDSDGYTSLRTMGGSSITIPIQPYATDLKSTGKTIEIEFKTHNVLNYDAPVISCMSGGRGFEIYADHAIFKSAQSEKEIRFTTDKRLRIAISTMPRDADLEKDYRYLWIYIDGEYQGMNQYADNDSFIQATPVNITVGGNTQCGVDLYNIRVYNSYLGEEDVLLNYIADRQNLLEMFELYEANNVMENGSVSINKLPADLPYVVFEGPRSPTYKGDKITVKFTLYDLYERNRTLASDAIQIDVQGTSSQYYYVKNFKIKLKNGAILNGTAVAVFAIRDGEIAVKEFTLKADVASSESANNIVLEKLYEDLTRYLGILTPPQQENGARRQGVDGFPCVIFWDYGDGPEFVGKYNFNNDKGTFDTFGFGEGDECWDVKSSSSQLTKFHSTEFTGNWWKDEYESIYPEVDPADEEKQYQDTAKLRPMTEFLYSTWQDAATNETLPSPITYENVTYTKDTAAYRLAKYKAEYGNWYDLDNAALYYVFTLTLLLVDSRQKNEHITYWNSIQKWWELVWDFDTALGNDNLGGMTIEYWMEDIDLINGEFVYNGQDNVKWVNFRQAFWERARTMYQRMRSSGLFDPEYIKKIFHDWQSAWPKAIWNADGHYKYAAPYEKEKIASYFAMAYGSKGWQRDELIDWRFAYIDSLFDVEDALKSVMFRPYYTVTEEEREAGAVDLTIDVYKKSYVTVVFDSTKVSNRVVGNSLSTVIHNPLRQATQAVVGVHNAKMIKAIHGLENMYVRYLDTSNAINMQTIEVGSNAAGYRNEVTTEISVGTNDKLYLLDMRNCVNYGTGEQKVPDLRHCANIREVYLDGTQALGVDLPNGGVLETLHLPATTNSIVIRNHPKLLDENLVVAGWTNVEQLWLENLPGIDMRTALNKVPAGTAVRLIGFRWECADAAEIEALLDKLDTMRGIDVNAAGQGVEVDQAQVSGVIHTQALTGAQIAAYNQRYRYLTVLADETIATVTFKSWNGNTTLGYGTSTNGRAVETNVTNPARTSTDKYDYTFAGWSNMPASSEIEPNNGSVNPNALNGTLKDITLYAAYSGTIRKYTVYFARNANDGGGTLYTQSNVPYGTTPSYSGATPTTTQGSATDYPFNGWSPALGPITGNITYYAVFGSPVEIKEITDTWEQIFAAEADGTYASKYNVGSYVVLAADTEGVVCAEIAAKNADPLADGTGNAKITWITKYLANTNKRMNPDVVTVYKYPDVPSWSASGNTWTSQNRYNISSAKATWTLTATSDGTITIGYKTSNSNSSRNKFTTITVNGTAVATDFCNTTVTNYEVTVTSGDTVTIYAQYEQLTSSQSYYGQIIFSGTATFTTAADVQDAPNRQVDYYTEGTGAVGGWVHTEMRTYVRETFKAKLPEIVQNHIVAVKKYTRNIDSAGNAVNNVESIETVWLPSYREIFGGTSYETTGPTYTALYKDSESRKKYKIGSSSAFWWWLRSANYYYNFLYVYGNGTSASGNANSAGGVAVGFCT